MMKTRTLIGSAAAALLLAACGSEAEAELDTSYEETLPSPVAEADEPDAPAPDNTSMSGGADEQVDEMASGDASLEGETTE